MKYIRIHPADNVAVALEDCQSGASSFRQAFHRLVYCGLEDLRFQKRHAFLISQHQKRVPWLDVIELALSAEND